MYALEELKLIKMGLECLKYLEVNQEPIKQKALNLVIEKVEKNCMDIYDRFND